MMIIDVSSLKAPNPPIESDDSSCDKQINEKPPTITEAKQATLIFRKYVKSVAGSKEILEQVCKFEDVLQRSTAKENQMKIRDFFTGT
jgi:hypothetical protein